MGKQLPCPLGDRGKEEIGGVGSFGRRIKKGFGLERQEGKGEDGRIEAGLRGRQYAK